VSAYNPNHYLKIAKLELSRTNYDFVIVFLSVVNDIVPRRVTDFSPRQSKETPFKIPQNLTYREFVSSLIYPAYVQLRKHSHLVVFLKNRHLSSIVRLGFSKSEFRKIYLRNEKNSPIWDNTAQICEEITLEGTQRGIPVVFILIPQDIQVDEYLGKQQILGAGIDHSLVDFDQPLRILSAKFKDRNLSLHDLTGILRQSYHQDGVMTHGRTDRHINPRGHEIVGDYLKKIVLQTLANT